MTDAPLNPGRTNRTVPAIVTGLALLWTAGAVAAPWLAAKDTVFAPWLRLLYRPGCHQMPERCLDLGFGPMAVCARCIALYIGGCLGLLWKTVRNRPGRPHPVWLAVIAAPSIVDFAAGLVGLPSLPNAPRFLLALPLGLLAGLYIGDALIEIVRLNAGGENPTQPEKDSVG